MQGGAKLSDEQEGGESHATNKFNARSILSNTTKFKLTNRSDTDMPINSKSIKV